MHLAKRANDHNTDTTLTDNISSLEVSGNPGISAVADATVVAEEEVEIPKKKKKTPSEFTPTVRKVAEQMISAMQRVKENYVPPPNLTSFMTAIDLMLRVDKRNQQLILDVFSWALTDEFWVAHMFCKNPAEYLRKKFDSLEMKMSHKPKKERKFAPSSNDERSLKKFEEWSKGAL
jgi:hypothetical protein